MSSSESPCVLKRPTHAGRAELLLFEMALERVCFEVVCFARIARRGAAFLNVSVSERFASGRAERCSLIGP